MNAVFHYVLAILEGGLAGGFFYCARQAKENKVLLHLVSALWFALSVLDALEGGRELRELKNAQTLEMNGGNDND
ncbi:MAG: hypothetical protein K2N78_10750 [Oscillospiraceae bacterium]|nr:hypothetical protein [Oscillospiraceae bacterium]